MSRSSSVETQPSQAREQGLAGRRDQERVGRSLSRSQTSGRTSSRCTAIESLMRRSLASSGASRLTATEILMGPSLESSLASSAASSRESRREERSQRRSPRGHASTEGRRHHRPPSGLDRNWRERVTNDFEDEWDSFADSALVRMPNYDGEWIIATVSSDVNDWLRVLNISGRNVIDGLGRSLRIEEKNGCFHINGGELFIGGRHLYRQGKTGTMISFRRLYSQSSWRNAAPG